MDIAAKMKLIVLPSLLTVSLMANDAAYNRGETLYFSKGCSSCHGPEAEGSSTYPKLAQQQKKYLVQKLTDFRAGKASSPAQQMMAQFAQNLSDRDINDIATFCSDHKEKKLPDVSDDLLGGFGS